MGAKDNEAATRWCVVRMEDGKIVATFWLELAGAGAHGAGAGAGGGWDKIRRAQSCRGVLDMSRQREQRAGRDSVGFSES